MSIINDYGFPFTSVSGDREYSSSDWRSYFLSLFFNGVIGDIMNELQVKPQTIPNKTVFVDTGSVLINGALLSNTSTKTLPVEENTSGNSRIDRVVARLDISSRKIEFAIIKGTPAASPSPPSLTRNDTIYELSLAKITLANGYSTIISGNIVSERLDEALCGYSKTAYMQTFDDENNLLKYDRNVTTVDGAGNPTVIEYRNNNSVLKMKRTYSNPNSNGFYQTVVEQFYMANGETVYKTHTYTIVYFANGIVDTMTRVVS